MTALKWLFLLVIVSVLIASSILIPRLKKNVLPQEIAITITPRNESSLTANFSKIGSIINKEAGLVLMYAEPGQLALSIKLQFTPDSICNTESGQNQCEKVIFKEDKVYFTNSSLQLKLFSINPSNLLFTALQFQTRVRWVYIQSQVLKMMMS